MNRDTFMNQAQARATGAFVQRNLQKKTTANVSAFTAGWRGALAAREDFDVSEPLSKLEQQLVDVLGRLHCGALCLGTKDFSPEVWKRDLGRAGDVLVIASRRKAGIEA